MTKKIRRTRLGAETNMLPVRLTDRELLDRGGRVSALLKQIDEMEVEAKETANRYKSDVKSLASKVAQIAKQVRNGAEDRSVECEIWLAENSKVETIRLDSGEIVDVREATTKELQAALFETDPDPSTPAKKPAAKSKPAAKKPAAAKAKKPAAAKPARGTASRPAAKPVAAASGPRPVPDHPKGA